jgi:hypothetical protein
VLGYASEDIASGDRQHPVDAGERGGQGRRSVVVGFADPDAASFEIAGLADVAHGGHDVVRRGAAVDE